MSAIHSHYRFHWESVSGYSYESVNESLCTVDFWNYCVCIRRLYWLDQAYSVIVIVVGLQPELITDNSAVQATNTCIRLWRMTSDHKRTLQLHDLHLSTWGTLARLGSVLFLFDYSAYHKTRLHDSRAMMISGACQTIIHVTAVRAGGEGMQRKHVGNCW